MQILFFNEIHYRKNKELLDIENKEIILRNAVRAVIIDGNKILMAYLQKTDEYKFPGGGQNENETAENALRREVLEEVGYIVNEILKKIGIITEFDTSREGKNYVFKMISEYYLVEIEDIQVKQNLEEYEKEYGFTPCWVEIEKAYKTNIEKINTNAETTPGIKRETIALEKLMLEYNK